MSSNANFDRHAAAWLADGPTELNDRVLDAALHEISLTHQRRRWPAPWTIGVSPLLARAGALVGVVGVVSVLALAVLRPASFGGPGTSPTPAPTPVPTVPPTVAPSATPAPTPRIPGATIAKDGLQLVPGTRYVLPDFEPVFTFVGSGLTFGIDGPGYAWFEHVTGREDAVGVVQPRTAFAEGGAAEPVPTNIVAWLQGRSDLVISSITPVTVGAVEGTLIEGVVPEGAFHNAGNAINILCPSADGCAFESGGSLGYAPGNHVLILVTTVGGLPVTAIASASEANWPALRADFDAFLRSFEFPS